MALSMTGSTRSSRLSHHLNTERCIQQLAAQLLARGRLGGAAPPPNHPTPFVTALDGCTTKKVGQLYSLRGWGLGWGYTHSQTSPPSICARAWADQATPYRPTDTYCVPGVRAGNSPCGCPLGALAGARGVNRRPAGTTMLEILLYGP